jgi:ABC-type transporter Mla MlaB component
MHLIPKHVQPDGDAPWEGDRDTASRSTRVSRALACPRFDQGSCTSGAAAVGDRRQRVAAGQLVVRWGRRRTTVITWLSGALDQATATMLDREIDAHPTGTMRFIVDLTELELIDSSGLETLEGIHRTATERGESLCFRYGQHLAQWPRGLVGSVPRRSEWAPQSASVGDENSYFALAMACADVGHARSGDRPG